MLPPNLARALAKGTVMSCFVFVCLFCCFCFRFLFFPRITIIVHVCHIENLIVLSYHPQDIDWKCRYRPILRVRAFFHKTIRVCHVYCNFKIGFTCRITVIFGTLKDGSLLINTLASNVFFSYRNIFQNGVDALPKIVDAFLSKSSNFHLVRIIR